MSKVPNPRSSRFLLVSATDPEKGGENSFYMKLILRPTSTSAEISLRIMLFLSTPDSYS